MRVSIVPPTYAVKDLHKVHGDRFSLDVTQLTVGRGEVLGVVGPNGSGKSTLLRLLGFLEAPDKGEIRFQGQVVGFPAPLAVRRRVTMVFQRPLLLSGSVEHNV